MVFRFADRSAAAAANRSLGGEGNISKRCRSETALENDSIKITIKADDTASFRATVNGFLRALQVFESVEIDMK